jgi:hypothetical protein
MQGIDIFFSKDIETGSAMQAVSAIMQVPLENFWNGEIDDVGDLIAKTEVDAWVVYWATDHPDFPLKLDLYTDLEGELPAMLPKLRILLNGDIAVPDEASTDPDQIILFGAGGVQQTAYLRDV